MAQPAPTKPTRKSAAMNYSESIDYFLGKGTVSKAAIFDSGGKPLAGSPDLNISDQDARAIFACVRIPVHVCSKTRFGLFIGQTHYICFSVKNQTLIGIAKDDLFVAHHCDDVMIIAFIRLNLPDTTVSCLGEVWTFAEELKSHMEVSNFVQ